MDRNKIALLFLLPLIAAGGCIGEDYANCPTGLYVTFETRNPKHDYFKQAQRVDLYFYDTEGVLAAEYNYERSDLRQSDCAAFVTQLPQGEYRLLAVVNSGFETQTENIQNYSTISSRITKNTVEHNLTDFFSAAKQVVVTPSSSWSHSERMTLDKHNNNITLNIVYDGYVAPPETSLEAFIIENNGLFQFGDSKCILPCPVRYLPWKSTYSDAMPSSFEIPTMHIWHDSEQKGICDVTVFLQETGRDGPTGRTVAVKLTQELLKVKDPKTGELLYDTDEKLLFNDQYELTITLGPNFSIIALIINDWAAIGGGVEI